MTHRTEKYNQNNRYKPIKAAVLSGHNIITIGKRRRVSHTDFANTFDLSPQLVGGLLREWHSVPGQRHSVWFGDDGVMFADSTAVLALADGLRLQPTVIAGLVAALEVAV